MKKTLGLTLAALLLGSPMVSNDAKAADDARVYYNKGVVFEVPSLGFDAKLNTQLQTFYMFENNDGGPERNDFEISRARIGVSGNLLKKEFSYLVLGDFVGSTDSGSSDGKKSADLRDAWFQWNYCVEEGKWRVGQWKTPFTQQFQLADIALQIPVTALPVNQFNLGRNVGTGVLGKIGMVGYQVSVFNGNSDGEGVNRPAKDTDLEGLGQVYITGGGYDRWYESDYEQTQGLGWTAGISGGYEQAEETVDVNTDIVHLNADAGIKTSGFSLIGEIMYDNGDVEDGDSFNDLGYFVQAGYFIIPKDIEIAGRFGAVNLDASDLNKYEYTLGLNKYITSYLKLQGLASFINSNPDEGESTTDSRYQVFLTGAF